ncbi:TrkA family potassium uptake protein [Kineococcus sp. NUM-3379]
MARYREPVVVIGLGRFGTALALELTRQGTDVLGVDRRPELVQRLAGRLRHVLIADTTDADALRDIGVPDFSRAVVSIGSDQQASILTTALLADLEIEKIWAKALSRQHARILERVGAHHVVLPEHEMGERVAHLVTGRMLDYIEVDPHWAIARTTPPRALVGTPLGRSKLRARHGVTVVSVKRARQEEFTYADADTELSYGDQILVAGRPEDVERFVESD